MPNRYRMALTFRIPVVWLIGLTSLAGATTDPALWVPARWDGGPLEVARRGKIDARFRDTINHWYEPSTLQLLDSTPINCILVTLGTGASAETEVAQRRQLKDYVPAAKKRGIAVLGVVYPGSGVASVIEAAKELQLEGLVLDGEFAPDFAANLARQFAGIVIPIEQDAASARSSAAPLIAMQGVRPNARDLADMGIRAGASAEPWIDSNIWLVRSLRYGNTRRPVWISQEPNPVSEGDYIRCVGDVAVAGGRWIVSLDDELRVNLLKKDADALGTWRRIAGSLKFGEDHADWRQYTPFGNLGIVIDQTADFDEYLNLAARRQVPYRLIRREELNAGSLASFRSVMAFAAPTDSERKILQNFASNGGVVIAGPSWGNAPKDDGYAEIPTGKGRIVVYKDEPPDAEAAAKDLQDLLEPQLIGLSAFNVPSAITYVSTEGGSVLIQVLNYAGRPAERITLRFNGVFKRARFYTPENAPQDLVTSEAQNGRTEILIPKLAAWGAVLLEQGN